MKIVSLERGEEKTKRKRTGATQIELVSPSLSLSSSDFLRSDRARNSTHDECRFRAAPSYIFFAGKHRSARTHHTSRDTGYKTRARIIFRSDENLYYLARPLIAKSEPIRLVMIDKRPYINNSRYSARQ